MFLSLGSYQSDKLVQVCVLLKVGLILHGDLCFSAWDQSDKFVKLYVELKGVQTLDKEAVTSKFTDR